MSTLITGMLNPMLKYRFRVNFFFGNNEPCNTMTNQLIDFKYDLKTKKAQCHIRIPEIGDKIEKQLCDFCDYGHLCVIEAVSGKDGIVMHSVALSIEHVEKCEIEYDYALSEVAAATLIFNFNNVSCTSYLEEIAQ